MSSAAILLEAVFFWLLRATVTASVLVGLILLFQWALGRRLGIRARCFLWLILLLVLVVPWTPHGQLGTDSRSAPAWMRSCVPSLLAGSNQSDAPIVAIGDVFADEALLAQRMDDTMQCKALPWPVAMGLDAPAVRVLTLIWLGGIAVFVGYIALAHVHLWRVLAGASPVTDPTVLALLDDCKRLLDVRAEVSVLATDALSSPALFGCRRPRLLLSGMLLAEPDRRGELRHIFLHELAHLKRRDILVAQLVSLVHVLQWFNPLVALACRRMRADRELACDALALFVLDPEETHAYGRTVVRQLERLGETRRPPILAALTGDKFRIRQRIALIAGFDKARYRCSPVALTFVIGLICIGLAVRVARSQVPGGAVESAVVTWEVRARRDLPTTHQDLHENIYRTCIRNMLTGKFLVADGERVRCDADEVGDAGLWEVRFDVDSSTAESDMYLYSVAARKYLVSDEAGNLALSAERPTEAARWGTYPRPQGLWWVSRYCQNGYLRVEENGQVKAVPGGRDAGSYWGGRAVWRVKTSDDPAAHPQWYREKIPGPD